jgi:Tol biopolymer transport system component
MTQAGMILGTAAYMSPEQARGRPVDRRADIWAFGCVLYEMLTGKRAFDGDDVSETMAAVLKSDPDWSRLPSSTSPHVRRLLRRTLDKDPARRLADIRDARLELDEPDVGAPTPRRRTLTRERLFWLAATAALAIALIVSWRAPGAVERPASPVADTALQRADLALRVPATTEPASIELSPDGQWVVFVASTDGRPKLWLLPLSTASTSRPLRGTDGASYPAWSPDSRSICFFSNEQLHRLDIDGGVPKPVVFAPVGTGCSWGNDNLLLYTAVPDAGVALFPPPAGSANGVLADLTLAGRGQRFPQFLPDGRHFLYYEVETRAVMLGAIDSQDRRQLFVADAAPEVVAPNEILFVLDRALYVQTFDTATFALTGSRQKLGDDIAVDDRGAAAMSASRTGTVIFRTGSGERTRRLIEVGRDGTVRRVLIDRHAGPLLNPNLSPDGAKLIFNRSEAGNTNLVELDLVRLVPTALTTAPTPEITPLYLDDGSVLYAGPSTAPGPRGFVVTRLTPGGPPAQVNIPGPGFPTDALPDGTVLFRVPDQKSGWDLWAGHIDGSSPPKPVLNSEAVERVAQFSPDGKWIAYEMRNPETGFEIFVQSYPLRPGTRKQVSAGGGSQVRWVGNEIFYVSANGFLTSVSAVPGADGRDLVLGTDRRPLFPAAVESNVDGGIQHTYAVFPDGQRFILSTYVESPGAALALILNRPRGPSSR